MIQTMQLDPNAAVYSNDEIVAKVNAASAQITRASVVSAAALVAGAAKANLDAMSDDERDYIKTNPTTGEEKIVAMQRNAAGKLQITVIP